MVVFGSGEALYFNPSMREREDSDVSSPLVKRMKKNGSSRGPESRAVPTASPGSPKLQREDTFVIEDLRRGGGGGPKKGGAEKTETPARRQWKSFDHGSLQNGWAEKKHPGPAADRQNSALSPTSSSSDAHFDRLREDLAQETGDPESHLRVANDLLGDTADLEPDEVRYREEQAAFWTLKAAERGHEEAKARLREMLRDETKSLEISTREKMEGLLKMSEEDLLAQRLANTAFRKMSMGVSNYVTLQQLAESREEAPKASEEAHHFDCPEGEKVFQQDLSLAAKEFCSGDVPRLDERLRATERDRILLRHRPAEVLATFYGSVCLVLALVHAVVVKSLLCQLLVCYAIYSLGFCASEAKRHNVCLGVAFTAASLLTLHQVSRDVIANRRFGVWERIFRRRNVMNEEEAKLAKTNFDNAEIVGRAARNLCAAFLCLYLFRDVAVLRSLGLLSVLFSVATSDARAALLLACSASASLDFVPWVMLCDWIPPQLELVRGSVDVARMCFFSLAFVSFSALRKSAVAGLYNAVVVAMVTQLFKERVAGEPAGKTAEMVQISAVTAAVMILGYSAINYRVRRASNILLCSVVVLGGVWSLLGRPMLPAAEPRVLTWGEFRAACPSEQASIASQVSCLEAEGSEVDWEGTVAHIRVFREKHYQVKRLLYDQARKYSCEGESTSYFCRTVSLAEEALRPRHGGEVEVKIRTAFMQEEAVLVRVSSEAWDALRSLVPGGKLRFKGVLDNAVGVPRVGAEDIQFQ